MKFYKKIRGLRAAAPEPPVAQPCSTLYYMQPGYLNYQPTSRIICQIFLNFGLQFSNFHFNLLGLNKIKRAKASSFDFTDPLPINPVLKDSFAEKKCQTKIERIRAM